MGIIGRRVFGLEIRTGYDLLQGEGIMTSTPVTFKTILPKKLQTQKMLNVLVNGCTEMGKQMVKDFEATTKTWQGDKPNFRAKVVIDPPNMPMFGKFPNKISVEVRPLDDNSRGAMKWFFLNYGTKVRYAMMTPGFIPKTTIGNLSSRAGKGKMLFVSKKHPMPGIKARKWNIALRRKWLDEYKKRMLALMYPMVKVSDNLYAYVGPSGGLF